MKGTIIYQTRQKQHAEVGPVPHDKQTAVTAFSVVIVRYAKVPNNLALNLLWLRSKII